MFSPQSKSLDPSCPGLKREEFHRRPVVALPVLVSALHPVDFFSHQLSPGVCRPGRSKAASPTSRHYFDVSDHVRVPNDDTSTHRVMCLCSDRIMSHTKTSGRNGHQARRESNEPSRG